MALSAIIVKVPAAELLVGDLRQRFDSTAALGVPAHITVLSPFMPAEQITPGVLHQVQDALADMRAFDFLLETIGRFPATTYLAPTHAEPFVALTMAVVARFPAYPPYGGIHPRVIPHLTVAHGDAANAAEAEIELGHRLRNHDPVRAKCETLALLENTSGQWKTLHEFSLPPG
ncbi:hypothetical protein PI87_01345 [Ralstonia sp. A12]|uniref:2'-5' RNA ligase family protein n=1 Tax=Ralstonia sp. A12 TaxID=1217052 RepID=UPI000573AECC|nr:2'-5' RNA ligase family protein [Ralstonia sp. A12]KHK58437.1 hypothetical protein PI87_01345 [Ralstonia sp. A12]